MVSRGYTGVVSGDAILVRGLEKRYGAKAAVDGLDLEVPRGSFFGFLGPNGAGKSTTIRILTGLIPFDRGTVEVLGFPLPGGDLEIKRRIGLVPDESLLFDRLTGAEYLEFVERGKPLRFPLHECCPVTTSRVFKVRVQRPDHRSLTR